MKIVISICLVCLLGTLSSAGAIEQKEFTEETFTTEFLVTNIPEFVSTPKNGTAWEILASTEEVPYSETMPDGLVNEGSRPKFTPIVQALDGKEVIMQGYMFPLSPNEDQSMFLFGPFPMSCPFHYHVTPNMVIEVSVAKPIPLSFEAINIKGVIQLVPRDDEFNMFYRIQNAEVIKP